jgi:hypothetical protein
MEQEIMNCWRVTDDIDSVAHFVGDLEMEATDKDAVLNMLIGMRQLYQVKFEVLFDTFEELIHAGELNANLKNFKWEWPENFPEGTEDDNS